MTKQNDVACVAPLEIDWVSKAEIIAYFTRNEFKDELGHSLLLNRVFIALVENHPNKS